MSDFVPEWDAKFVDVPQEMLFELILAANYMDIKSLLDLTCAKVASMIKGKTPEDIRRTFNIKNDFTPEEEAQGEWPRGGNAEILHRLNAKQTPHRPQRSLPPPPPLRPLPASVKEENKWCEEL